MSRSGYSTFSGNPSVEEKHCVEVSCYDRSRVELTAQPAKLCIESLLAICAVLRWRMSPGGVLIGLLWHGL